MELIKSGNLEKTLNKLEYDYLIYTKNYNVEEKSHIFKGDPRKLEKKLIKPWICNSPFKLVINIFDYSFQIFNF